MFTLFPNREEFVYIIWEFWKTAINHVFLCWTEDFDLKNFFNTLPNYYLQVLLGTLDAATLALGHLTPVTPAASPV